MSHDLKLERLLSALPEVAFGEFTGLQARREPYADALDSMAGSGCDLRVGGRWTFMSGPPRALPARETNAFQVDGWPKRLVYRSTMMPDGSSADTGMEVTFRDQDGRTRMTIVQGGFPAAGVRDEFAGRWADILDGGGRAAAARVTGRS